MTRTHQMIGAAVACVLLLAGCSAAAPPTLDGLTLPAKNVDLWSMPLDPFMLPTADSQLSNYAENLLISPCMAKAGFDWAIPWQDISAPTGGTVNAVGWRLFSVSIAQKYGYHYAPSADSNVAAQRRFFAEKSSISTQESDALERCVLSVRETNPLLPGSAQIATSLAMPSEAALRDTAVLEAAVAWRACMTPVGISDLPASPAGMPSRSLEARFPSGDPHDLAPTITADEIRIATLDAGCRASTGYTQALYDGTWKRQLVALAENRDTLERTATTIAKHRTASLAIISAHAPAH